MSDIEHKTLAYMTSPDNVARACDLGVRAEAFEDPLCRAAFQFVVNYWENTERNSAPTQFVIEHEWPGFKLLDEPEESLTWLVESLQKRYIVNQLQELMSDSLRTVREDPRAAVQSMRAALDTVHECGGGGSDLDGEYLFGDQLDDLPPPQPLIADVLLRHTYAILRGRDHTFKSFVALDWALSLATGVPWQGKLVNPTRVLYVAGEGAHGIIRRKKAWESAHGVTVAPEMFVVRKSAVNLFRTGPEFGHLLNKVKRGQFGLVVFDTLRRMSGGAEGNGSDMGVVVDNLEAVKRQTADGSVLVIAHTDKSDHDTRGFSGIEDDADTVWSAKRNKDANEVTISCTKMKDGADGHRFVLGLVPEQDSLAVRPAGVGNVLRQKLGDSDLKVMDTLREHFSEQGAPAAGLVDKTGLSRATVSRCCSALVASGQLTKKKVGNRVHYLPVAQQVVDQDA
jgi:hypothetical protein